MPVQPIMSLSAAEQGVTVAEYAVLLGLVVVLSIGGLQMLGGSISTLLGDSGKKASSSNIMQMIAPTAQATAVTTLGLKGSGFYTVEVNPATGQPELTMVNGANATTTNVSSIDGSRMNVLGTAMVARSLDELVAQQTDPELRAYYGQMARLSYYLAGAEGEIDQVPGLEINPMINNRVYTKGDGLNDVIRYSSQLEALMNNPPSQLSAASFNEAMPLASTVYNIAHQYQNAFSEFIGPNDKVTQNFAVPQNCQPTSGFCNVGDGTPGSGLANADKAVTGLAMASKMIGYPYDQFVSLDQMRANADSVLASHQVDNMPVASTIQNAQSLQTMADTGTVDGSSVTLPTTPAAASNDTATVGGGNDSATLGSNKDKNCNNKSGSSSGSSSSSG